jgi:hypothetical protein|tara:strand:+ start:1543 stop:1875 length:333 start_codon:yes stop_codon:yes gene_type:complete
MKITKAQLKQIIREELEKLYEIPTWRKLQHLRDGTPHPGLHPGPRKGEHDGETCEQAHPDETHEEWEEETPSKLPPYSPETRKRFHRQQSQRRDLARHKRARGLKPKVGE